MPARAAPVYRRGKYWLDWDRSADGELRSPNLTVFWYDPEARRIRSASTGTAEEGDGIVALDRRYLGDADEAPAFCHACGQPLAQAEAYLLTDAIADYLLEHTANVSSGGTLEARLDHVLRFVDAQEAEGGKFGLETTCAAACTHAFVNALRLWLRAQPVEHRNGAGVVTASRPRAPASVESVVAQVAAALNHAVKADPPRSDKRPTYRPFPPGQVQRKRRTRIDEAELARMLSYAAEPDRQRESLHAFLVASICTIARPSSVVDISIVPERNQWWPGAPTLDLNPAGRQQTKKFRPVVPVMPVMGEWLAAELATYQALPIEERAGRGWLVNYHGRGVLNVRTAWRNMLSELKLPTGREWQAYLLRHSLATLVRNRGAEKWDLKGFMGHDAGGVTETYAVGEFPSVVRALSEVIDEIARRAPGALHRTNTGAAALPSVKGRQAMSP